MQKRVINVIAKPPSERGKQEIDIILPWLRKKSQLMQSLEKGTELVFNVYSGLLQSVYNIQNINQE